MELAKPKTKKKTKTNRTPQHVDEQALSDIDDVDIEFPSTSSTAIDALPEEECSSATTPLMQALCLEDAIDDEVGTDPPFETMTTEQQSDINIESPAAIASAPPPCSAPLDSIEQPSVAQYSDIPSAPQIGLRLQSAQLSSVQYPDLQHIQRELHVLPDVPRLTETVATANAATIASTAAAIAPFTREQMRDLYANRELELADTIEEQFVRTELDADYKSHVLHELLTKYARCRQTLRINRMDVEAVQKRIGQLEPLLWQREKRTVRYQATCADSIVVRGSEQFEFASVDESVFDKVSTQLAELLNLVSFNCALNLYLAETHKLQITQLVQQLQRLQPIDANTLGHLREAISIFFSFLRRTLPDQVFGDDLKAWLRQLVAHRLHTAATWSDHLFLTFHVMRCPAGVSDWATAFVQLPRPPTDGPANLAAARFDSVELHRCVAYLRTLLRPVAGRAAFLQKHVRPRTTSETPMDPVKEDLWILVDSDGDDDAAGSGELAGDGERAAGPGAVLKEKDLIALLNQLPLEQMFSSITMATSDNGSTITIDTDAVNATHVLKLLAFANELVQLLGDGLRTYRTERFRQFAKMLGRLIRHTVVYVAETYSLFKRGRAFDGLSAATGERIGVEFDVFVLRAADFIYRSRCLGAWQYLAVLPFVELRAETVWKLYVFLVSGGPAGVIDGVGSDDHKSMALSADFLQRHFNDTVIDVPAEDMYYLLQTFASIAQSRDAAGVDRALIECVMLHLFEIGFINAATTASSYKIVRDLLANITDESPALLSALLERTKQRFADIDPGTSAVYLFKALPLASWQPTEEDFQIIAAWLLNAGYDSAENGLARTIFSRLNWNFARDAADGVAEALHLPADVHVRMACLLCQVAARHAPETVGRSGITESVRQVSNLVKGSATAQQRFATWCWNMVTVLRLHGMDHGREARALLLQQPAQAMARVPEVERLAAVHDGVAAGCPLALYVAVLATQWGHSVPLVCHRGFAQIARLLDDYRQSAVVRCLELVTPLFVECPESLSKCEAFQSILTQLLNADKTYMKMAKDLITADYPGPVVEMLGQMIQSQCIQHHHYTFASPLPLCMLWLECLTAPSAWQRDTNAVYLVDVVLRVAWQSPAMWSHAKEFFRFMCTSKGDDQRATVRSTSSFLAPFLGGGSAAGATLPALPAVSANSLWMSLITLELEHEILELQTGVWPELLRQLRASSSSSGRVTLDSVLKTAVTAVHCTHAPTAATLVLYKYCNLIVTCAPDHRLLPVVCQRFFQLYLGRVPMADDEKRFAGAFGVADKFYEHNVALMKRLKKHFAHVEAEAKAVSLKSDDDGMVAFHASCSRIFGTFGLWLEETRLNQLDGGVQQFAQFPPQYEMHRLARIFGGDDSYWNDFVHLASVREQQRTEAHKWQQSCFRTSSTVSRKAPARATVRRDPHETIARQLATYDAPLPVPAMAADAPIIPVAHDMDRLLGLLQSDFARLNATARDFHTAVQELNFTDCNYKDLVRVLWSNRSTRCSRTLQCSSMLSSSSCRGGREVTITITEPTVDGRIQNKIERNREKHQLNIDRQMSAPTSDTVLVFVRIQHYVRDILARYAHLQQSSQTQHSTTNNDLCAIAAVGIAFFYEIVNGMSEFADAFPPAHELLGEVLGQLGVLIRDNQSGEGVRLLQTALRRPHLVQLLSDMFTPSATAPVYFLEMYQFLVDSHIQKCDPKILFVLLSKFDVAKWLVTFMPKLVDITQLLNIIVKGLESWNQADAALIQGVLRRHLVHIFQYDFPEHYGEVLQTVLAGCSDQRLLPTVLAELLHSIYQMANCPLQTDALHQVLPSPADDRVCASDGQQQLKQQQQLNECVTNFAATQQLFGFKAVQDTLGLLAQHYRNERLQHGLHGLYPKHRDLCGVLAVLLHSYADALVVTAVYAYPGLLADKLLEWLWPSLCDCFAPWLMPYYPNAMQPPSGAGAQQTQPANWIRQVLANNDVLLPWSELYSGREAQHMLHTFVDCALYILDTLPGSDQLLGHLFHWYEAHYAHVCVPRHVRQPVHIALHRLPWERFQPQPQHIDCIHRTLQQYLPEAHTFVGHVFVRVDWSGWLRQQLPIWDTVPDLRHRMLGSLLHVYVQLSFEPNVRETEGGAPLLRMLQEAGAFPWAQLPYASVGPVFDALVLIAEPSIVLTTLDAERQHEAVDAAVLNILELASAMRPANIPAGPGVSIGERLSVTQTQAKRILYVKTIVRLLRLCGTKYQQLLATTDGLSAFRAAVRRLLDLIDSLTRAEVALGQPETVDLMIEVVGSLQLPGEFTSKMFVEALIQWQVECDHVTALLPATLSAIGTCKSFTNNVIALLESSLLQYFRLSADDGAGKMVASNTTSSTGTWQRVAELLGASLPSIEGTDLVQRHHLLTLHVFTVYKLRSLPNVGEQLTLLQKLHLILENYKTSEATEPKLLVLWSLMITFGVQRLRHSDNAKSLLLTLGRFLQGVSAHADGWGDGVLGAFGLRRDAISRRRRLATRCLACVVFSLFPDTSDPRMPCKEYTLAIDELAAHIQSKRYADVRSVGLLAIELVQTQRTATAAIASGAAFEAQTTQNVCSLLRLFYKEAGFLATLEQLWVFHK